MIRPSLLLIALALCGGARPPADRETGAFALCQGGARTDCVVDGDTFWLRGEKIRIADIDTPETRKAQCGAERDMGLRATHRLQRLLNAGAFSLMPADRETDRYGRSLRVVSRDGRSIGAMLVAEGLARPWSGSRQPWCRS